MEKNEFKVLNDKMDNVVEYMEKRFDVIDKRFDVIDKRFNGVDDRFDGIDKRFTDNDKAHDRMLSQIDYAIGQIQKLDQERLFSFERVNRLEEDVVIIKKHLKLS